jgi:hypothetical protein
MVIWISVEEMIDWSSSGVRSWAERCASIPKLMPQFLYTACFKARALRRNAFLPGSPAVAIWSRQISRTPCRGSASPESNFLAGFSKTVVIPYGGAANQEAISRPHGNDDLCAGGDCLNQTTGFNTYAVR